MPANVRVDQSTNALNDQCARSAARPARRTRGPLRFRIAPAPNNSCVTGAYPGDGPRVHHARVRACHRTEHWAA